MKKKLFKNCNSNSEVILKKTRWCVSALEDDLRKQLKLALKGPQVLLNMLSLKSGHLSKHYHPQLILDYFTQCKTLLCTMIIH